MDTTRLIFSSLICGLGVIYGGAQLYRWSRPVTHDVWARWDSAAGAARRRRRRRLGAIIVVITSVAFFFGVNFLSPSGSHAGYLVFWLIVLLLVVWLCGLGILDLIATRRVQIRMLASIHDHLTETQLDRDRDATGETREETS